MNEWLDTQTRAILGNSLPPKLTSLGESRYSLLLLKRGIDEARVGDTIAAIQNDSPRPTAELPFVVAQGLSLEEAFAGQFALACCDCAASFVPDKTASVTDRRWWHQFYTQV